MTDENRYKADPIKINRFTNPYETDLDQSISDYTRFLPSIHRTESNQRFFGSTVNQLLSSGSTETISALWGRLQRKNYDFENEIFQSEADADRLNYQFVPGVVSRKNDQIVNTASYINTLKRLQSMGVDTSNHDKLFSEQGYTLDVPINLDMFLNYSNYYWLEGDVPVIELDFENVSFDIDDIVQRSEYTGGPSGSELEFLTGMRVKFVGNNITSTSGDYEEDVIYQVENVGGTNIKLIRVIDDTIGWQSPNLQPYTYERFRGWDPRIGLSDEIKTATTFTRSSDTDNWIVEISGHGYENGNSVHITTMNNDELSGKEFNIQILETDNNKFELERSKDFGGTDTSISNVKIQKVLYQITWDETPWNERYFKYIDNTETETDDDLNNAGTTKSYVVMERWCNDKNPWARGNHWYSIYTLQAISDYLDDVDIDSLANSITVAKRPIIEYRANIELYNSGTTYKGMVDHIVNINDYDIVSDTTNGVPSDFRIEKEGYVFQDGDEFIFSQIEGETIGIDNYETIDFNKIFKVEENNSGTLLMAETTRSVSDLDFVIIRYGSKTGKAFHLKDDYWIESQNKTYKGDHPLFELYDSDQTLLSSYNSTDFAGEHIFRYEIDPHGTFDQELGFAPKIASTDNFLFEWTLSNNRYRSDITTTDNTDITGFYFWKDTETDQYHNGWANVRGGQRVPIIQTTVADGEENPTFDLPSSEYEHPTEYTLTYDSNEGFRWADHSYIDITDQGYANPELVWAKGVEYTIHNPDSETIEFEDIADNTITSTTNGTDITITIPSDYAYEKAIYQNGTYSGEIILVDDLPTRIVVTKNEQILQKDDEWTLTGQNIEITTDTNKGDVISVRVIIDENDINAVYDVAPIHYFNPQNGPFTGASLAELSKHFNQQLVSMPTFSGKVTGENSYHKSRRLHQYDGTIRQQIFDVARLQYLIDTEKLNPCRALKSFAKDYEEFKSYFRNKVAQLWKTNDYDTIRELVDDALSEIHIGKNDNFKYSRSDMLYFQHYVEETHPGDGTTTTFEIPNSINQYDNNQNHCQVWVDNDPQIKSTDYTIENTNEIEFTTAPESGTTITIRWYSENELSYVPFSTVKLGFFRPTTVELDC